MTITIQTLNITPRGLDLWTVFWTFYEQDRKRSIWPVFNVSLSSLPLKACPILPSWQPNAGQPVKTSQPPQVLGQCLTLLKKGLRKTNCVWEKKGGGGINVPVASDASHARKHDLWARFTRWWRFLLWYSRASRGWGGGGGGCMLIWWEKLSSRVPFFILTLLMTWW